MSYSGDLNNVVSFLEDNEIVSTERIEQLEALIYDDEKTASIEIIDNLIEKITSLLNTGEQKDV